MHISLRETGSQMEHDKFMDHNQYYRHIEDDCEDNILNELLGIINITPIPAVTFLNFYKEVVIESPATITYVFDDSLSCKTTEAQSRAIAYCNNTIIRSASLRHAVFANAHFQPDTKEIIISDLSYVDVFPEQRSSVRVKMDSQFSVIIEAGPSQFRGRLRELSLHGCAVDIPDSQLLENYKYFYLNMEMPFKTFKGTNKARIMARLIRGDQNERNYRCIFMFEHDNTTEDQIGMLLAQRQTEIIRELK